MPEKSKAGRGPYPPEVRERAVRMVLDHQGEYPSQWKAIESIAAKLAINHETLRQWVRRAETDAGERPGLTTDERVRMKELERENFELRRANEMAASTGGRNELCVLLQWCQIAKCLARSTVEASLDAA
jgi:transposase